MRSRLLSSYKHDHRHSSLPYSYQSKRRKRQIFFSRRFRILSIIVSVVLILSSVGYYYKLRTNDSSLYDSSDGYDDDTYNQNTAARLRYVQPVVDNRLYPLVTLVIKTTNSTNTQSYFQKLIQDCPPIHQVVLLLPSNNTQYYNQSENIFVVNGTGLQDVAVLQTVLDKTSAIMLWDNENWDDEAFKVAYSWWKEQPFRVVGMSTTVLPESINVVDLWAGSIIHREYLDQYSLNNALRSSSAYSSFCEGLALQTLVPRIFQPPIVVESQMKITSSSSQQECDTNVIATVIKESAMVVPAAKVRGTPTDEFYNNIVPKEQESLSIADNKKKYYVGCNPADWQHYVRPEFYHFFTQLEQVYHWEELVLSEDTIFNDTKTLVDNPPAVIFFCEQHVEKAELLPIPKLKEAGVKVAVSVDDTDMFNRFTQDEMVSILRNVDVIVSCYAYRLSSYFSSVVLPKDVTLPKFLWIPHAASPSFTSGSFNDKPIHRFFLSGATSSHYPIRRWLKDVFAPRHRNVVKTYRHPGYQKHATNQSDIYATNVRAYVAGLSTTMLYRRMVAKTFEIPATGSLLVMNLDIEEMMKAVGMINMKHYVGFDQENPSEMLLWVIDPANAGVVNRIRRTGMEFVRAHHRIIDRVDALDAFFTTGKVTYDMPEFSKQHPCPMVGYNSVEECIADFNKRVNTWHYSKAKDIPFPLQKGYDKKQTIIEGIRPYGG